MSTNITGSNTMSSAAPAKTTKRVAKKDVAATPVVAEVPAPVAAPAPAPAKVSKKAAATAATATATAAAPVVAAPIATPVAVAPEAQPVAAAVEAVPQVSVAEEIDALVRRTTELREAATEQLRALQRLQKHVARELKEAGKRRRNKRKAEDGENVPKRPTIFTTPVPLRDELAALLGKPKGTQMTPAEVTKAVRTYIDTHNLKDRTNGHMIHPDANMRRVLSVSDGETLTYRNIQKYLYRLYDLKTAKAATATATA
jgi:SWIB/MDM2 domain